MNNALGSHRKKGPAEGHARSRLARLVERRGIRQMVRHSQEPTTLVVFELAEADGGILLTVVESGLDKIPIARRATVLRLNTSGWEEQMRNIEKHVAAS